MNANRIKQRLIATLKLRGGGVLALVNAFKEFDADGNGSLSWEEFCNAMKKAGVNPSPQDIRTLFIDMDKDGNNEVSFPEFILSLRGKLSDRRRDVINQIFRNIDTDSDGVVSMSDIGACFNPKNHPEVKAGRKPVALLLKEFFESFSTVTDTGLVNLNQFLEYYANIAAFDEDDEFEEAMNAVWNTSKLSAKQKTKTLQSLSDRQTSSVSTADDLLSQLKESLVARGSIGIIGLQRKFRIMDDDGSKSLSFSEFKKAIRESSLNFSDIELSLLFNYFDKDRNGSINFDELLVGVRVR
jgi:Ca2+-binding EF-hand superfamily protein